MPVTLDSAQKNLQDARDRLLSKDFTRALPLYEKLTRQHPGVAAIWLEYGNAASGLRMAALADRAWNQACEVEPRNAELIGLVGHHYQGLRQPEKARAFFARAAAADPRGINSRISLAVLLEQNHQLAEARAAVAECLAIDPRDDQARYFHAVLDRRESKLEEAERRLRDLIASEPKHPFIRYASRYELAQVLDRTDRFDEAMTCLLEAKNIVRSLTDTELLIQGYDQGAGSAWRFISRLPSDILHTWAGFFPERKRSTIPPLAFLGGHPRSGTTLL